MAINDECGVFGMFAPGEDVATSTFFALYALQHRGQEAAGISVSDGKRTVVTKDVGLVSQVFRESDLAAMGGHIASGHCRYSTTGASTKENAQPHLQYTDGGVPLTFAHNGNLTNTDVLAERLQVDVTSDSDIMARTVIREVNGNGDVAKGLFAACRLMEGAFSVVVTEPGKVHAARDRHGFRPLQLGRLPSGGWVVASETAALDIVGAVLVRDIKPGEVITISGDGVQSAQFDTPQWAFCLFEWVYLARPDHRQDGSSVLSARRKMGQALALEAPVDNADIVIPVPEAGRDAAAGFAEQASLPFADGLVKNRYVGRTFIQPTDSLRQLGIRLKLSVVKEVVEGRNVVVVDDSIVRGNTSRQLVHMLRDAGAETVHLRITSPPVTNPCFYGIDMASKAELLGADMTVQQMNDFIGSDTLHFLTLEGLKQSVPTPPDSVCDACFTGKYVKHKPV